MNAGMGRAINLQPAPALHRASLDAEVPLARDLSANVSGLPARRPTGAVIHRSERQRTEAATVCYTEAPSDRLHHHSTPLVSSSDPLPWWTCTRDTQSTPRTDHQGWYHA